MARKHECPDCGVSHEMSAEGRIKRLEERVKELEAKQPVCSHPYYLYYPYYQTIPQWTWTNNTTDTVTVPQITTYTS